MTGSPRDVGSGGRGDHFEIRRRLTALTASPETVLRRHWFCLAVRSPPVSGTSPRKNSGTLGRSGARGAGAGIARPWGDRARPESLDADRFSRAAGRVWHSHPATRDASTRRPHTPVPCVFHAEHHPKPTSRPCSASSAGMRNTAASSVSSFSQLLVRSASPVWVASRISTCFSHDRVGLDLLRESCRFVVVVVLVFLACLL